MNIKAWENFYENTQKLSKPASASELLSSSDNMEVIQLLISVLQGFIDKENLHNHLKIYINKELRNDLIQEMIANPPTQEKSLECWSKEIFGDQKFGMILIGLEEFSNSFAEKAAKIIHPLLKVAGLPLNGFSFLFFMGNYGFTPFGIHKESTGEDGFLFHLGPGKKIFYTWDSPRYNSIQHQKETFHNISEMLKESQKYPLNPGDTMFIPHYVYHVADTPDFSMSLVLDYINPPMDRFENELLVETGEEKLIEHSDYGKPIGLEESISSLAERLSIETIQKKLSIRLERKLASLKSNGGIRKKSIRNSKTLIPNGDFLFQGKSIFPLFWDLHNPDEILIIARGHRIPKKYNPQIIELLEKLNDGNPISSYEVMEKMEPGWDLIDFYGLVQELASVEAIQIQPSEKVIENI